jgi:DNA-binding GntR family transcriptional regulator
LDDARAPDLYDDLRQAILRGEYAFGSRLKIDAIARRFGVSHMPVRKALLQLVGDRLVTTERNRGASVRSIDLEFVRNIYDVVIPLEALLARRAAERMTAPTQQRLVQAQRQFERAAKRRDPEGVAETNRQFHEIINAQAANPEASDIVNRYQELLRAFRRAYGFDATRLPGVIADHHALLAAFAAGDAEGAALIAGGHAAKARNDLIGTIKSSAESEGETEQ